MKPQEALERIKVYNEIYSKNLPCEMPLNEAFIMSVKALEKQIPKKPNRKPYTTIHGDLKIRNLYICASCKAIVTKYKKSWIYPKPINNYCSNCGQALDWSDT